jgi:malonate transporter and related proteins
MLDILAITGPIYLCILAGYLATRWAVFSKADMRVLGKFVLNFALPALLFNAVSQRSLREVMHLDYLLAYGLGSGLVLACGYLWARYVDRTAPSYRAYFAMGMSCSNSGYVGYPVASLAVGPLAAVALALNMVVENLFKLPVLMALADRDADAASGPQRRLGEVLWATVVGLARTPMLVAIVLGFACSTLEWPLPTAVAKTVSLFAQASTAIALFVIGGALVGLRLQGKRTVVAKIVLGKLVLHPLSVLLMLTWVVPVSDPQLRTAALLYAAMPMLGIYPILSYRHGHEEVSAAALLATTVGSFFTLNTLLWGLQHYPL